MPREAENGTAPISPGTELGCHRGEMDALVPSFPIAMVSLTPLRLDLTDEEQLVEMHRRVTLV